jgi:hypothetical protein
MVSIRKRQHHSVTKQCSKREENVMTQIIGGAIDLTGQVINGLLIKNRVSRVPLRYETECVKCGSRTVFSHSHLMQAAGGALNAAHCRLDNCFLFGTAKRSEPPTERPRHEPEATASVSVAAPVKAAPAPVPIAAPKVSDEYTRYVRQMRLWGYQETGIGSWADFQMLSQKQLERIMAPVIEAEKRQEAKTISLSLEEQERERMRRTYGV